MNYCPLFIQDGKINLITSCISDNFVKLWDFDSCQLIKKVDNFPFTFCIWIFTDKNKNYLIATNENLKSYTLPDFQQFKKYTKFSKQERHKFIIEKINNVPLIFVFDENELKIFNFYSGNIFRSINFNLSLNLCNFILWDNEHIIICNDDWVWSRNGFSFIYKINSDKITQFSKGYNFFKYEFNNTKYLFYNSNQDCIKAFKEGKLDIKEKNKINKNYSLLMLFVFVLIISIILFKK